MGIASPVRSFHIARDAGSHSLIKFSNATYGHLVSDGVDVGMQSDGSGLFQTKEATPLILATNASEKMRINSNGRVGVGTASPDTE